MWKDDGRADFGRGKQKGNKDVHSKLRSVRQVRLPTCARLC
jgi:hypothetical protein